MNKSIIILTTTVLSLLLASCSEDTSLSNSKMEQIQPLMLTVITPATDKIWGLSEPENDSQWDELQTATTTMISASELILSGGIKSDSSIIKDSSEWQDFAKKMLNESRNISKAIKLRDQEQLQIAGDNLYEACEGCHLHFFQSPEQNL